MIMLKNRDIGDASNFFLPPTPTRLAALVHPHDLSGHSGISPST